MARRKCVRCGKAAGKANAFCSACGARLPQLTTQTRPSAPKGAIGAGCYVTWCFSLLLFLALTLPVILLWITEGAEFGIFDFDDIAFDFFKALTGRRTDYEKAMGTLQYVGLGFLPVVILPLYFVLSRAEDKGKVAGSVMSHVFAGILSFTTFLFLLLLLVLYDFVGIARTASLVLFILSALALLPVMFLTGKRFGGYGLLTLLMTLAAGFLIAVYIVPLFGGGLVIFGDLFWIFIFALVISAGGGGSVIYVRILSY